MLRTGELVDYIGGGKDKFNKLAAVLKLVDKHGSEPCGAIHGGSTPLCGTNRD